MLKDYPAEPKYYPGRGPAGCKRTLVIWTKHFAHAKTMFESVMNRNTRLVCDQQSQLPPAVTMQFVRAYRPGSTRAQYGQTTRFAL